MKLTHLSLLSIFCFVFFFFSCDDATSHKKIEFAKNPVIAHRGAWKTKDLPKNSIAAFREAVRLKCHGSEFDVRMSKDEVLIVTHDKDYGGLIIEETNYEELAKHKLPNGEKLPTLKEFMLEGMKNNTTTGFVCELKPTSSAERNTIIADKALSLVAELNAEEFIIAYISFSFDILTRITEKNPTALTQYLDGSKSPQVLKENDIDGLDYLVYKLEKNPNWIKEAKELDLILNAWVANSEEKIDWLLAHDFDFLTTDEPELVFERLKKKSIK